MRVLCTTDVLWMRECRAALLSQGLQHRWHSFRPGFLVLEVPDIETEHTSDILSRQFADARLSAREQVRMPYRHIPLLLRPEFAFWLSFSVAMAVFYVVTGGTEERSDWFLGGAFVVRLFQEGEWWRMFTAATLHADAGHVLGNVLFTVPLGWGASERSSNSHALVGWGLAAVIGFLATVVFSSADVSVGSSGGVFGLLGVGMGAALNQRWAMGRREWMRIIGAAVSLLAFTAFSPNANITAHVAGFVVGGLFGWIAHRIPIGAARAMAGVMIGAWVMAWNSV